MNSKNGVELMAIALEYKNKYMDYEFNYLGIDCVAELDLSFDNDSIGVYEFGSMRCVDKRPDYLASVNLDSLTIGPRDKIIPPGSALWDKVEDFLNNECLDDIHNECLRRAE